MICILYIFLVNVDLSTETGVPPVIVSHHQMYVGYLNNRYLKKNNFRAFKLSMAIVQKKRRIESLIRQIKSYNIEFIVTTGLAVNRDKNRIFNFGLREGLKR